MPLRVEDTRVLAAIDRVGIRSLTIKIWQPVRRQWIKSGG